MANYCQGKTKQQETDDGLTMICLVSVWTILLIAIGLALWLIGGD